MIFLNEIMVVIYVMIFSDEVMVVNEAMIVLN